MDDNTASTTATPTVPGVTRLGEVAFTDQTVEFIKANAGNWVTLQTLRGSRAWTMSQTRTRARSLQAHLARCGVQAAVQAVPQSYGAAMVALAR